MDDFCKDCANREQRRQALLERYAEMQQILCKDIKTISKTVRCELVFFAICKNTRKDYNFMHDFWSKIVQNGEGC